MVKGRYLKRRLKWSIDEMHQCASAFKNNGCAALIQSAFILTAPLTVAREHIFYLMESQLACTLSATF